MEKFGGGEWENFEGQEVSVSLAELGYQIERIEKEMDKHPDILFLRLQHAELLEDYDKLNPEPLRTPREPLSRDPRNKLN